MKILEGIRKNNNGGYIVDYTLDKFDDIIQLTGPVLHKSSLYGNAYYFGYEFSSESSSKDRSEFIKALRGNSVDALSESELRQLISNPLADLDHQVGLKSIDALVYPVSGLNNLVKHMVSVTNSMLPHGIGYASYEVVKNIPSNVQFDYDKFAADKGGEDSQSFKDSLPYIQSMMQKIHTLDYFSIARDAKPKYRPYIMNYLKLSDNSDSHKLSKLVNAKRILLIDDINTSGSTIRELLRIIRNINISSQVFVYTLIGRD